MWYSTVHVTPSCTLYMYVHGAAKACNCRVKIHFHACRLLYLLSNMPLLTSGRAVDATPFCHYDTLTSRMFLVENASQMRQLRDITYVGTKT